MPLTLTEKQKTRVVCLLRKAMRAKIWHDKYMIAVGDVLAAACGSITAGVQDDLYKLPDELYGEFFEECQDVLAYPSLVSEFPESSILAAVEKLVEKANRKANKYAARRG